MTRFCKKIVAGILVAAVLLSVGFLGTRFSNSEIQLADHDIVQAF